MFLFACLFGLASGHGYISNPPAQFYDLSTKTTYSAIADERIDTAFANLKWDDSPDNNLKTFTESFSRSRFKTLKSLFDSQFKGCNNSRVDVSRVDVSASKSMTWQNDEYKEGFIKSHSGPCEAWLDDVMVARSDDCRTTFPNYPAVIPIDYSNCDGKCLLRFFWIALHEPKWQLYKQCVPLVNNQIGSKRNCTCIR